MYSNKKTCRIQVNLIGSGVFHEKSACFPRNYFTRIWSLLFSPAERIYCLTVFLFLADSSHYRRSSLFNSGIWRKGLRLHIARGYFNRIWPAFSCGEPPRNLAGSYWYIHPYNCSRLPPSASENRCRIIPGNLILNSCRIAPVL